MSKIGIITPNHRTFTFIVNESCKHLQKDVRKNYKMISKINDVRGREFEKVGKAYDAYDVEDYVLIMDHLELHKIEIENIVDDKIV